MTKRMSVEAQPRDYIDLTSRIDMLCSEINRVADRMENFYSSLCGSRPKAPVADKGSPNTDGMLNLANVKIDIAMSSIGDMDYILNDLSPRLTG